MCCTCGCVTQLSATAPGERLRARCTCSGWCGDPTARLSRGWVRSSVAARAGRSYSVEAATSSRAVRTSRQAQVVYSGTADVVQRPRIREPKVVGQSLQYLLNTSEAYQGLSATRSDGANICQCSCGNGARRPEVLAPTESYMMGQWHGLCRRSGPAVSCVRNFAGLGRACEARSDDWTTRCFRVQFSSRGEGACRMN